MGKPSNHNTQRGLFMAGIFQPPQGGLEGKAWTKRPRLCRAAEGIGVTWHGEAAPHPGLSNSEGDERWSFLPVPQCRSSCAPRLQGQPVRNGTGAAPLSWHPPSGLDMRMGPLLGTCCPNPPDLLALFRALGLPLGSWE